MNVIKIACPDCESRVAKLAFGAAQAPGFVCWESYKVKDSDENCVTKIGDDYFIRCSGVACKWSKRIPMPDLVKQTFQAVREHITPLALIPEDLKSLLKEYEADPDRWIEFSIKSKPHQPNQVKKIGSNCSILAGAHESGRRGRRKLQTQAKKTVNASSDS